MRSRTPGARTPRWDTRAVPRDWDATTYDRIADPQFRWGSAVLDRLTLVDDERVLDAGCGSGRVTEVLLERFPRASVVALDGSPSMLEQARARLARFGERITFVEADLLDPLPVEPADVVFSTATFHWVPDHDRLFANIAGALRPGGRLLAQCGGAGNLASVVSALEDLGAPTFEGNKVFASAEETAARLEETGFGRIHCWLHEEPTPFPSLDELAPFLKTVALGSHVASMTPDGADAFALQVARGLPRLELDYVRLNIEAERISPAYEQV
jgi:trans-aconitate 2-methyltransferase